MTEHPQRSTNHGRSRLIPLGFGGLYAPVGNHIAHFYYTRQEAQDILIAFLKVGLEAGHQCFCLIPPPWQRGLVEGLTAAAVEVEGALASGQLVVDEGRPTLEAMRDWWTGLLARTPGRFPVVRLCGDMMWSQAKMPSYEEFMAWESTVNMVESPHYMALCQYDLAQLPGSVVVDALKTHHLCIIGDVIHQNPFYASPALFVAELRGRQAMRQPP
jgi:MEDS: MEthanogen/methylotroph, DcmR Sensory domain